WAAASFPRLFTQNFGGFTGGSALVIHFKTGPTAAPGKSGAVTLAEWNSPPSAIDATLSTSPCDFGPGLAPPKSLVGPSNTIQVFFQVGGVPAPGGIPILDVNTDYYINIKNEANSTCMQPPANGTCDKFIDFAKPRGT